MEGRRVKVLNQSLNNPTELNNTYVRHLNVKYHKILKQKGRQDDYVETLVCNGH